MSPVIVAVLSCKFFQVPVTQSLKTKHILKKARTQKELFSSSTSIKVSPVETKGQNLATKVAKDRPSHSTNSRLKPADITKIVPEQSKKSATMSSSLVSKSVISQHHDVDIIKTQSRKKFDIQAPTVSISAVKRDIENFRKRDRKETTKKTNIPTSFSDDDVICID